MSRRKEKTSSSLGLLELVDFNLKILREAIRAVPAMKYALAALALVSVSGLGVVLAPNVRLSVAVPAYLVVMLLLVVFSRVLYLSHGALALPAMVLVWAFTVLFVIAAAAALVAVATDHLPKFREFLLASEKLGPAGTDQDTKPLDWEGAPPKKTPVASVIVSGKRFVEDRESQLYTTPVASGGKNQTVETKVDLPQGTEWDPSVVPTFDQTRGEKGSCESVVIRSRTELVLRTSFRAITNPIGRDRPGYVTCVVKARVLRAVRTEKDFSLSVKQLFPNKQLRVSLPKNTVSYEVQIVPLDGGAKSEVLSEEAPEGSVAAVAREGETLIVMSHE